MALRQVTEGLWTVEDELRLPGGVCLPIRATIVALPAGELLVHSPTPLRGELKHPNDFQPRGARYVLNAHADAERPGIQLLLQPRLDGG